MPGPLDRLLRDESVAAAFETLSSMPGTDLTSLLLAVFRERAGRVTPSDVLGARERSRFPVPAGAPASALRTAEDRVMGVLRSRFEEVALSPVAPFGAHSALGDVDQHNVVSAVRGLEVAADPTLGLALEAALARRAIRSEAPGSAEPVRRCAVQPVTRAQRFDAPDAFAHFTIAGLVTAGRDTGSHAFESESLADHVASQVAALEACGADRVSVEVADLTDGRLDGLVDVVAGAAPTADVAGGERSAGYYRSAAFTLRAGFGDREVEVGDGGIVDWTARLLADAKERLMISGIGLDRVALAMG
ncbi:MAG: hypothetical protein R3290_11650 [Acidimicrobiia bacterium]|nr:hypothetical protein [Acidimicrobiia bacterium]